MLGELPPLKSSNRESKESKCHSFLPPLPKLGFLLIFVSNALLSNLVVCFGAIGYGLLCCSLVNIPSLIICGQWTAGSVQADDDMNIGDEVMELTLSKDLEQQITSAIDASFLLQLASPTVTYHTGLVLFLSEHLYFVN